MSGDSGKDSVPPKNLGAETGRRLLDVLLLFTSSQPKWTIQEISDETGFSLSTTYRYISALKDSGLLDRVGDSRYRVTDLVLVLAEAAKAARPPIAEIAKPILRQIRDQTGESVFVARRAGWNVIMVAREESRSPVRLQFEPGRPMLLHSGSLSRVLLATMPEHDRSRYLDTLDDETRAREVLSAQSLAEVKKNGSAESFEEVDEGIWGTSAAVKIDGEGTAALGCAAPLYRNDETQREKIRLLIADGAKKLTAALSLAPGDISQ